MDEWFLTRIVHETLVGLGMDGGQANQAVLALKLAIADPEPLFNQMYATPSDLLEWALTERDGQGALGVNHFQEIVWFNGDGMEDFMLWLLAMRVFADAEGQEAREVAVSGLYSAYKRADYQVEKLRLLLRKPVKN